MRESRTYGSVRGQCREALVYSTVDLMIDGKFNNFALRYWSCVKI